MSHSFTIKMTKTGPMEFKTKFDKEQFPDLYFDEGPDSGGNDNYPSATRILAASVMNCLSASFTFCLTKSRLPMDDFELETTATLTTDRNEQNRIRVKHIAVDLKPSFKNEIVTEEFKNKIERCISIFQDYCIVTSSVKDGIEITTNISV